MANSVWIDLFNGMTNNGTDIVFTLPIALPNGTAAAPSLTFASETNTGFYRNALHQLGVSIAGTESFEFNNNGFNLLNSSPLIFTSGSQIAEIAAGQFRFTKDSTHGVTLDVATDATLKLFARDGSSAATFQANKVNAVANFQQNGTDGVTAGPFTAITSITVKGGIITAITGT